MRLLSVTPKYEPFELPIDAKGHQYIGYFDLSSLSQSVCGKYGSFSLIDDQNRLLQFSVNCDIWQLMQQQLQAVQFDRNQHLYIWLEMDTHGVIQNTRVFQVPWHLGQLIQVYQSTFHFESLYLLIKLITGFSTPALKFFCQELLNDIVLMTRFVSLPASKRYHHAYPGGLLTHSLECAFIARQNLEIISELSPREKEVTILSALLHDIGKTQTLSMKGHTSIGSLMDHEQLTLQILAKPLAALSCRWSNGAETLQYLLTWKSSMGFCRYLGGNIIKIADHISTSASLRRMAFDNKPEYYGFSLFETGSTKLCLNRVI